MKELLTAFIEDGLREGECTREQSIPVRSPLPVARRATGVPIPAVSNTQISEILDSEDAYAGR